MLIADLREMATRANRTARLLAIPIFGLSLTMPAQEVSSAVSTQSPFLGSVPSARARPGTLSLTLKDAMDRGLRSNLGLLLGAEDTRAAHGYRWQALSRLLPQVNGSVSGSQQQIDLETMVGPNTLPPAISPFPHPFDVFDARLNASGALFDWSALQAERSASHQATAAARTYQDARDTVVLAVGNAYLMAVAGKARVASATAERDTAQALYQLALDREKAGLSPQIDTLRALVELKSRQENLLAAENDYAIEKLNLARAIGLPDGQAFELSTQLPYRPLAGQAFQQALAQAYRSRGDLQAAIAHVAAARKQLEAARAERYPSIGFHANWGDIGSAPSDAHQTYLVAGTAQVPLFQGGRVHGDLEAANAHLRQAQERVSDLKEKVAYDVRTALLNLNTNASQVDVAQTNVTLAAQTQEQARDRFASGVTDNIEVIQAQQAVAQADDTYIASLYRYNLSKLNLTRAMGVAEREGLAYLGESQP